MSGRYIGNVFLLAIVFYLFACTSKSSPPVDPATESDVVVDPLPSWNDGNTKRAIISYVKDVTNQQSPNFIQVVDRIAAFDNDGTLWSEQPIYFQFFFALERVKAMAPDHPEWQKNQPFKAVLENDMSALMKQGERGLLEIVMTTHSGNTTDEFEMLVKNWITTAHHPTKNVLFTDLVFQPMLELLEYLRANEFKTFIVSGGGVEFMRPWVEQVYGIPKNQVIGSSVQTEYDFNNGNPVIRRLAKINHLDDKEGKPIGITQFIGRKPVFVAGNSDGDLQMMRWSDSNTFKSFKLYVHHTDSIREWAYDRKSHIGTFTVALDEATAKDWTLADMKTDWKIIYPFEKNK